MKAYENFIAFDQVHKGSYQLFSKRKHETHVSTSKLSSSNKLYTCVNFINRSLSRIRL